MHINRLAAPTHHLFDEFVERKLRTHELEDGLTYEARLTALAGLDPWNAGGRYRFGVVVKATRKGVDGAPDLHNFVRCRAKDFMDACNALPSSRLALLDWFKAHDEGDPDTQAPDTVYPRPQSSP